MSKTVVGLFSTMAEAAKVKQELISEGYDSQQVTVVANNEGSTASEMTEGRYANDASGGTGEGIGEKISNFFRSLTGGDEDVHHHYASGLNSGGALVAVKAEDDEASEIAAMLKEHGARDIEGGSQGAPRGATGSAQPAYDSNATRGNMTGETTIPVIEEQLSVGKREVNRGGVRVYSHVTERPVEEDVTLREERINVERRPVNRAATAADFQAGQGSVIEMNAMGEEAVVGKSSRVVEEVLVGKQSSERTESIHDTVRKTEVEVENIAASEGRDRGIKSDDLTEADRVNDSMGTTGNKNRY